MTPPSLAHFTAAAREYCLLAEQDEPLGDTGLSKIRELLLKLMYHISSVDISPQEPDEDPLETAAETRLKVIRQFSALGIGSYWRVPHLFQMDSQAKPTMEVLSDNLTHIYSDLSRGLTYANRSQMKEACFHWSLSYRNHGWQHATHALVAIESHRICGAA